MNSSDIDNKKSELRIWAKNKRKEIDIKLVSNLIIYKLLELAEYKNAHNIMIFYPLPNEIDLLELTKDKTKNFYLPKICGDELLCCPYDNSTKLQLSSFKTLEPTTKPCNKENLDLIIVPALACDKKNYRLGYGKGFYDRFLKDLTAIKIVCIPQKLVLENIYPNDFDIPVDKIITE
ncbi:MAG: 5-formyltetrahydrofolate cyclo-ligase [bacterium]|nr:5-formyltetrahydrofolate cyclo-ligase [bacterium]